MKGRQYMSAKLAGPPEVREARNEFVVLDPRDPRQYNPLAGLESFADLLDRLFPWTVPGAPHGNQI